MQPNDFHDMENIKQMRKQWSVSLGSVLLCGGDLRVSVLLSLLTSSGCPLLRHWFPLCLFVNVGGKEVCAWTVLVLGPQLLSRCGGGECCSVSWQCS